MSETIIEPAETEAYLKKTLLEAGLDFAQPDPGIVWKVFLDFLETPVDYRSGNLRVMEDGTMLEIYRNKARDTIEFSMHRVIQIYDGPDGYHHMDHITLRLSYSPDPVLSSLASNWYPGNIHHIAASPEFEQLMQHRPLRCEISWCEQ